MTSFSRRKLLAAGSGFVLTALVASPAAAQDASPAASPSIGVQPDGSWVYTDNRGITLTLSGQPTVFIAQTTSAAALWDFGIHAAGIYGPSRLADGSVDPQAGNIDLDQVKLLGDYPDIDLEAVVGIDPALYIDVDRGNGAPWYLDDQQAKALEAIVPIVTVLAANVPVTRTIADFATLAEALGADLQAPDIVAAREAWLTAEAAFKAAIAEKPGLKVLAISPAVDNAYIVNPNVVGDLLYYQELGLDLIVPEHPDPSTFGNFEIISWEQIGTYAATADLILIDQRDDLSVLDGIGIWGSLPAVQAKQVGTWYGVFPFTYQGLTETLGLMTTAIQNASADVAG